MARLFTITFLLIVLCWHAPARAQAKDIVIAGSDTINSELIPQLIEAYAKTLPGSTLTVAPPTPAGLPITILQNGRKRFGIKVLSEGSLTGLRAMSAGEADFATSSDRYTDEEIRQFQSLTGINLRAPGKENVLALDALTIIINRQNPLFGRVFALEEIAAIYAGRLGFWSQLGGAERRINVYSRNRQSGTYRHFKTKVLEPYGYDFGPNTQFLNSSADVREAVQKDVDGIGFIGGSHVGLQNHALTIRSPCGLVHRPDEFSVLTEAYPLTRRLYLYQPVDPRDPDARSLVDFMLRHPHARGVIFNSGFVDQVIYFELPEQEAFWARSSLKPGAQRLPASGEAVRIRLLDLLGTTRRLAINLRFESNSDKLDPKALADLQRLIAFLQGPVAEGKRIYLVGFADSRGSFEYNLDLSLRRARHVAQALALLGIPIADERVMGASWLAPVACETNEEGLYFNRRVEVWMDDAGAATPIPQRGTPSPLSKRN